MSDHTPTFADLCCALAEGNLGTSPDGATYQVSVYEMRRYFSRSRSSSTLFTPDSQASIAVTDPDSWSACIQTFVA